MSLYKRSAKKFNRLSFMSNCSYYTNAKFDTNKLGFEKILNKLAYRELASNDVYDSLNIKL